MSSYRPGSGAKARSRGNQVAALVANRQPETLAEQLLEAQEHNNELQEQLKVLLVDKHQSHIRVKQSQQALQAADARIEQLERQIDHHSPQQSGSSSPDRTGQLSARGPAAAPLSYTQQAGLISVLKDQNTVLKQSIQELEQQCSYLAQVGPAGNLADLQTCMAQLHQQSQITQQLVARVEEAECAAQGAAADAHAARQLLAEAQAMAEHVATDGSKSLGVQLAQHLLELLQSKELHHQPPARPASPSMAAAQDAHKVLVQQLLLLRGKLPGASSAHIHNVYGKDRLPEAANPRSGGEPNSRPGSANGCRSPSAAGSNSSGAFEMLRFLRAHVARMQATLDGLPGAAAAVQIMGLQEQPQQQQATHAGAADEPGQPRVHSPDQGSSPHESGLASSRDMWVQQNQQNTRRPGSAALPLRPRSASPHRASRPQSARMSGTSPTTQRGAAAIRATTPRQHRQATGPDLSPYINYPQKRPTSARGKASSADAVHELQQMVQMQHDQLQTQAFEVWQLQELLQDVQQQLLVAHQQLQKQQAAETQQQSQVKADKEQLPHHQQSVGEQERSGGQLQQELESAKMQVQELHIHNAMLRKQLEQLQSSHQHQCEQTILQQQGLQQQAEQLEQQEQLIVQLQRQLQQFSEQPQQPHHQELSSQTAALPLTRAQLARAIRAQAATLANVTPEQLSASSGDLLPELVQVCNSIAAILTVMNQLVHSLAETDDGSSCSATSEQLEGQLEHCTQELDECMTALQEVCVASRRVSAATASQRTSDASGAAPKPWTSTRASMPSALPALLSGDGTTQQEMDS